jgi:hypothetical protein
VRKVNTPKERGGEEERKQMIAYQKSKFQLAWRYIRLWG